MDILIAPCTWCKLFYFKALQAFELYFVSFANMVW